MGCSPVTGVSTIDTNQYYISNSDLGTFYSNAAVVDAAHAKADQFCRRKSKIVETLILDTEGLNSNDLGHVRLHFKCINSKK